MYDDRDTSMCTITMWYVEQGSFYPYIQGEVSVLTGLPLKHLCYLLTGVPPQPNSLPKYSCTDTTLIVNSVDSLWICESTSRHSYYITH